MTYKQINLEELEKLLTHFFDNDFTISVDLLRMSAGFIFYGEKHSKLKKKSSLFDTLRYLKDVKERNHLKELRDLVLYYEKKQRSIDEMFDRFENAMDEERFAINFQNACKTYLKIDCVAHQSKEYLYYPITSQTECVVGFENISYRDSLEEEIQHLSKVKGNQLVDQQNVYSAPLEKLNQVVSN